MKPSTEDIGKETTGKRTDRRFSCFALLLISLLWNGCSLGILPGDRTASQESAPLAQTEHTPPPNAVETAPFGEDEHFYRPEASQIWLQHNAPDEDQVQIYLKDLFDTIYFNWNQLAATRATRHQGNGGQVTVQFRLRADGEVRNLCVKESTMDPQSNFLALDAIASRAPFVPWPEDMVTAFGESKLFAVTFHYQ